MKCQKCQYENENGAKFCANCGSMIQVSSPTTATAANLPLQIRCPNCGIPNAENSLFCENCGAKIRQSAPVISQNTRQTATGKTSAAWWLLPILMTWVGGLIAFLVIRDTDNAKAKRLLICGILMVFVWLIIYVIIAFLGYSSVD
jgi:uncharacterized membrane protein YvbJ